MNDHSEWLRLLRERADLSWDDAEKIGEAAAALDRCGNRLREAEKRNADLQSQNGELLEENERLRELLAQGANYGRNLMADANDDQAAAIEVVCRSILEA